MPLEFGVENEDLTAEDAAVFYILVQIIPSWKMTQKVGGAWEAPGLCREVPFLLSVPLFRLLSITSNR